MRSILTLAAAALMSTLFAANAAEAAHAGPQSIGPALQTGTLAQPVHARHYHPRWRYAYRHRPYYRPYARARLHGYPYYGGGYYRPVAYGYCRAWARECAARWGWRTWRWDRCMRIHAC